MKTAKDWRKLMMAQLEKCYGTYSHQPTGEETKELRRLYQRYLLAKDVEKAAKPKTKKVNNQRIRSEL